MNQEVCKACRGEMWLKLVGAFLIVALCVLVVVLVDSKSCDGATAKIIPLGIAAAGLIAVALVYWASSEDCRHYNRSFTRSGQRPKILDNYDVDRRMGLSSEQSAEFRARLMSPD